MRLFTSLSSLVQQALQTPDSRRKTLLAGAAVLFVWVAFFDSHSLLRRTQWRMEYNTIAAENVRLQEQADSLDATIAAGLSDEVVEQIAREEYGMRRPGETVYRIQKDEGE
jgi:cell division protein FtsB